MLAISNHVFTVVFAIEMVLKAIANCYIFGEAAYFKVSQMEIIVQLLLRSLEPIGLRIAMYDHHHKKIHGMTHLCRISS